MIDFGFWVGSGVLKSGLFWKEEFTRVFRSSGLSCCPFVAAVIWYAKWGEASGGFDSELDFLRL